MFRCEGNVSGKLSLSFSTFLKVTLRDILLENPLQNLNGVTDFSLDEFLKN